MEWADSQGLGWSCLESLWIAMMETTLLVNDDLDIQWIEMRNVIDRVLLLFSTYHTYMVVTHLASPYKVAAVGKMPS